MSILPNASTHRDDDPLHVFGLVQVGLHRLDPRAVTPAGERYGFVQRLATARAYEHRRALGREPDRSRAPDSLAAARDDRRFAAKSEFHCG